MASSAVTEGDGVLEVPREHTSDEGESMGQELVSKLLPKLLCASELHLVP